MVGSVQTDGVFTNICRLRESGQMLTAGLKEVRNSSSTHFIILLLLLHHQLQLGVASKLDTRIHPCVSAYLTHL